MKRTFVLVLNNSVKAIIKQIKDSKLTFKLFLMKGAATMETVILEEIEEKIKATDYELAEILNRAEQLRNQKTELLQRKVYIEMNADIYAKTKQTKFTKKELCKRWKCSGTYFDWIKKATELKPSEQNGRILIYDIEEAEQAKEEYLDLKKAGIV